MKTWFLILTALTFCGISFSQQVSFFKGSWPQANDLAAKENKFIFVDAYTEWCGWCKVMDKEMFTDPDLAAFINDNFIPLKIDFEDSLGIVLSMKFRVWAYPTTLIFNSGGQLTGKFSGYSEDHGKYLEFLKTNREIKDEKVFAFDSRELDLQYPAFYSKSFIKGKENKWPEEEIVTKYLKGQDDLFSEINWSILLKFEPGAFDDFVIENLDKYSKFYGKEETIDFVYSVIYKNMRMAIDSSDKSYLDRALKLCDRLDTPEQSRIGVMMNYCQMAKDWQGFADALSSFIALKGYDDHMTINNNCWTIYENVDDKEILQKAVGWMKPVIDAEPIWMYLDTYAALLYKTGNLQQALNYSNKAIAAGEQEKQEDISSTKELREKIIKEMPAKE
jgi:thioredoxin-related protein